MADAERVPLVQEAFWRNEKLRHRLQLAEDRARRDPVWAEKMARRHAEFNAKRAALAAVPSPSSAAAVASEEKAALGAASICNDSELALVAPITCSTERPGGDKGATGASDDHDLNRVPATTTTTATAGVLAATATHGTDPCSLTPSTCSTECPGGHIGALPAACPTTDATPPCVLPAKSSAVASLESKDTDGDAVQPIIFNSEYVDLAIVNVPPVFTKVPWQSVASSDMKLTVALAVDGLMYTNLITDVTSQNGSSDNLEPVLRRFIKLISRSPHSKWPPMSLNGPFLSSADVHQEFMGIYSVTAVLSRLLPWPCFQFATGNTILLLPWDPGLPLCGIDTMFSTLVYGLAARVRSPSEVTCLQGNLIYELFSCSFVIELIKKGMVALEEQQLWISGECVSLLQPKPPWSHFAPTNSPSELMSDLRNVSESLYISGNSFELHMNCFAAWHVFCARFRLKAYYSVQDSGCLTSHFIQRAYFLMQWKIPWLFSYPVVTIILWLQFATQNSLDPSCDQFVTEGTTYFGSELIEWQISCWDVTYTIASVPAIKHISGSESYRHGMGLQLQSALLLEPHHHLSLEDLHSPCDVTKAQVACSLVQNYMRKIIVVLSITHSAMDMIIGWESRSMACSTWMKENVPTQLLEHRVACAHTYPAICQFLDLSELHWQHSSCKYSMSESFPWYIAWLLMVSSCAGSDSGISGNFANMWMMFRIIWLLDLVCSASGNKSDQLILPTMGESETYREKRNALVLPFYTRTVHNSLLVIWSWPYHSEHCACHYPTSGKVEATGVRNAAPTIHVIEQAHAGHDYYFDNVHADDNYYYDAFLDRVDHRLGLFNLVQVLVDQGYYRNCDNRERQVQWDPGGSTWHRLEVKPNFKEEGMLATSPAASTALGLGCRYWAWAAGMTRDNDYKYRQKRYDQHGLERLHNEGWWAGVVAAVLPPLAGARRRVYEVAFPTSRERREFEETALRPHRVFRAGHWVPAAEVDDGSPLFPEGTQVEVSQSAKSFGESWRPATVLKVIGATNFLIQYTHTGSDGEFATEILDAQYIRPAPNARKFRFSRSSHVEVMHEGSWWPGVIEDVLGSGIDNKYVVKLKTSETDMDDVKRMDVLTVENTQLRPKFRWNGKIWLRCLEEKSDNVPTLASRKRPVSSALSLHREVGEASGEHGSYCEKKLKSADVVSEPIPENNEIKPPIPESNEIKLPIPENNEIKHKSSSYPGETVKEGNAVLAPPSLPPMAGFARLSDSSLAQSSHLKQACSQKIIIPSEPVTPQSQQLQASLFGTFGQPRPLPQGPLLGMRPLNPQTPKEVIAPKSIEEGGKTVSMWEDLARPKNGDDNVELHYNVTAGCGMLSETNIVDCVYPATTPKDTGGSHQGRGSAMDDRLSESSAIQHLPFSNTSPVWARIEAMGIFSELPQRLNLDQFQQHGPEVREGMALGLMLSFAILAESIDRLEKVQDDSGGMFEEKVQGLSFLEANGFDVGALRSRLEAFSCRKNPHDADDGTLEV